MPPYFSTNAVPLSEKVTPPTFRPYATSAREICILLPLTEAISVPFSRKDSRSLPISTVKGLPACPSSMPRALKRCSQAEETIVIKDGYKQLCIPAKELLYVEVFDKHLQYRLANDTIRTYGTLKEAGERLPAEMFFRINKEQIVNMKHIASVSGSTIVIGGREMIVGRAAKKAFLEAFQKVNR